MASRSVTQLKAQKERIFNDHRISDTLKQDILDTIDQAIEQQLVIKRWIGFLRLMAQRSSWAVSINSMINEYMYGNTDPKVIEAANRYISRQKELD